MADHEIEAGRDETPREPEREMADDALDDLFAPLDEDGDEALQETSPSAEDAEGGALPSAEAREPYALSYTPHCALAPRSYQSAAVQAWLRARGRGTIVLPTGAGKTVVALNAIAQLGVRTLIVVPTIELLRQWHGQIVRALGVPEEEAGMIGGGERRTGSVTVITYDSASMRRRRLAGYGLLVFDEAHHLPAASYRSIVERCPAPWRLGLSATLERADGRHAELDTLIGPVVYERQAHELASQRHIAAYREHRVYVDLSPEEQGRYEVLMAEWRWYLATHRGQFGSSASLFTDIIRRSGFDQGARRALRAHHEARLVAMNAEAKIGTIERVLQQHAKEKAIIFSEYADMVDRISRQLVVPAITYRTPAAERRAILEGFRAGTYSKLVSGRVLNEGVDVPDASVAIVASGSSSMREYVQRLGRVLRPKPEEAHLYELISRRTTERQSARRRRPKREPRAPLAT